jgi:hypothetical protein
MDADSPVPEPDIPAWSRPKPVRLEQDAAEEKREIFALAALFALFRLMIPCWFPPFYSEFRHFLYPFMVLANPDFVKAFDSRTSLPFIDYWLEYPPVFPWIALGVYKLQMLIAGTAVSLRQAIVFSGSVSLVLALADVANLCLIYSIAKTIRGHKAGIRVAVVYALLFFPLVVASSYFDTFAVLAILLSLWAMVRGNVKLSAFACGVGIMTKFIPVIFIPVAIKYVARLPKKLPPQAELRFPPYGGQGGAESLMQKRTSSGDWNQLINYLGTLLLTVGVLSVPFLLVRGDLYLMPLRVAGNRPGWETIRALAGGQKDFGHVGPTQAYLASHPDYLKDIANENPERIRSILAVSKTLNQREADRARLLARFSTKLDYLQPAKDPLMLPMLGVLGILYLGAWLWMRPRATPINITALTGITMMTLLIWSPGWSPQFIAYVLPLVLIGLTQRTGIIMAAIITFINFLEMPVWLGLRLVYGAPERFAPLLWLVVILRTLFLVVIALALFARAQAMPESVDQGKRQTLNFQH